VRLHGACSSVTDVLRAALLVMLALVACTGGEPVAVPSPSAQAVPFRAISEAQNATFCVEGPEFAVAHDDDEWIDIYSRQADCRPSGDVSLPRVRFDHPSQAEVVLAAWWKVEGCLGFDVRTTSVERNGDAVVVTAVSSGPEEGQACATALGGLESFLAVREEAGFAGARTVRFVLDGEMAGEVPAT
jgi:hypothetical protein